MSTEHRHEKNMWYESDTIAAIATGMGNSGIGIIRISGSESLSIGEKISKKKGFTNYDSHTAHYLPVYDRNSHLLDHAIYLLFKGPKSYTGEDVLEIQCHGGSYIIQRILEEVIYIGARAADPGEFTKRAFLNGRMDLTQAEAVMDLIESGNEYALQGAAGRLKGSLGNKIRKLREEILYHIAYIESALDDPEHISLDDYGDILQNFVDNVDNSVDKLLNSAENGQKIQEGIRTVIVGSPNVGKSTLWNTIIGENKAIVTNIPGTTRDALEERALFGGLELILTDTAGIRKTQDVVEKIGVEKSIEKVTSADLIFVCYQADQPISEDELNILKYCEDKPVFYVVNKCDLVSSDDEINNYCENLSCNIARITGKDIENIRSNLHQISAIHEEGLYELGEAVRKKFISSDISYNNEVMITAVRHKQLLMQVKESLERVKDAINMGLPEDFYTIDLMEAYQLLGAITGEAVEEDLIDEIFRKFCTGK